MTFSLRSPLNTAHRALALSCQECCHINFLFRENNILGEVPHEVPSPRRPRGPVRRIKEDTKTAGGIIIPETAQEKPQEGEVISVGPGLLDEKTGKRNPA